MDLREPENWRDYQSPPANDRDFAHRNQTGSILTISDIRVTAYGYLDSTRNHHGEISSRHILPRKKVAASYRNKEAALDPESVQKCTVEGSIPLHHNLAM
jgi:hypothetical protein